MNDSLLRNNTKQKAIVLVIIALLVFLLGFAIGTRFEKGRMQSEVSAQSNTSNPQKAYATQTINKTYQFPIKDSSGKVLMNIGYTVQDAQLMDQILVNGQPYTAVSGKTFLIIDLKLDNSSNQGVQLPTRDYIRLSVNGSKELLAADIHNDPVQVQAISTKYTRIGFPIDKNFKSLEIQVGQIDGSKDTIKLDKLKR